jgi:hypothetical protein
LDSQPAAWELKFVLEAVPVQLRQSKSQSRNFTAPDGTPVTGLSPTAIFIFIE